MGVCWCVFPGAKRRCAARFFFGAVSCKKINCSSSLCRYQFLQQPVFFFQAVRGGQICQCEKGNF